MTRGIAVAALVLLVCAAAIAYIRPGSWFYLTKGPFTVSATSTDADGDPLTFLFEVEWASSAGSGDWGWIVVHTEEVDGVEQQCGAYIGTMVYAPDRAGYWRCNVWAHDGFDLSEPGRVSWVMRWPRLEVDVEQWPGGALQVTHGWTYP